MFDVGDWKDGNGGLLAALVAVNAGGSGVAHAVPPAWTRFTTRPFSLRTAQRSARFGQARHKLVAMPSYDANVCEDGLLCGAAAGWGGDVARGMAVAKPVNVGVIGLGEVAQVIHLPILAALGDRFRLAAVCDASPTLLGAMGDRYGLPPDARHADDRALVRRPDLDAVLVLTSDEYHADTAIAALRHGKHVLVEKPIALTLADAEAIARARDEAGRQVMVGYMRRYAPAFLQAIAEVKRLERISYVRVRDIIGRNRLIIDQAHAVLRPDDLPAALLADKRARASRMVRAAIGEAPPELVRAYRLLCGLSSHDLSAMRELIGVPERVVAAAQWAGGTSSPSSSATGASAPCWRPGSTSRPVRRPHRGLRADLLGPGPVRHALHPPPADDPGRDRDGGGGLHRAGGAPDLHRPLHPRAAGVPRGRDHRRRAEDDPGGLHGGSAPLPPDHRRAARLGLRTLMAAESLDRRAAPVSPGRQPRATRTRRS